MNHYPIYDRKKSSTCPEGTVNPFAPVTCPQCRERLQKKVDADTAEAMRYKEGHQYRTFFLGSANHIANILNGTEAFRATGIAA